MLNLVFSLGKWVFLFFALCFGIVAVGMLGGNHTYKSEPEVKSRPDPIYPLPPVSLPRGSDYSLLDQYGSAWVYSYRISSGFLLLNTSSNSTQNNSEIRVGLANILFREDPSLHESLTHMTVRISPIDRRRLIISGTVVDLTTLKEMVARFGSQVIYEPGHPALGDELPEGSDYNAINDGSNVAHVYLKSGLIYLMLSENSGTVVVHPDFLVLEPWKDKPYFAPNEFTTWAEISKTMPHKIEVRAPDGQRVFEAIKQCLRRTYIHQPDDLRSMINVVLKDEGDALLKSAAYNSDTGSVQLEFTRPASYDAEKLDVPLELISVRLDSSASPIATVSYNEKTGGVTVLGNARIELVGYLFNLKRESVSNKQKEVSIPVVLASSGVSSQTGDSCVDLLRDVVEGVLRRVTITHEPEVANLVIQIDGKKKHLCKVPLQNIRSIINRSIPLRILKIMYDPGNSSLVEGVIIEGNFDAPLFQKINDAKKLAFSRGQIKL